MSGGEHPEDTAGSPLPSLSAQARPRGRGQAVLCLAGLL